jgi:hypothetical protein
MHPSIGSESEGFCASMTFLFLNVYIINIYIQKRKVIEAPLNPPLTPFGG